MSNVITFPVIPRRPAPGVATMELTSEMAVDMRKRLFAIIDACYDGLMQNQELMAVTDISRMLDGLDCAPNKK